MWGYPPHVIQFGGGQIPRGFVPSLKKNHFKELGWLVCPKKTGHTVPLRSPCRACMRVLEVDSYNPEKRGMNPGPAIRSGPADTAYHPGLTELRGQRFAPAKDGNMAENITIAMHPPRGASGAGTHVHDAAGDRAR